MKIRNKEDLNDVLAAELSKRKRELTSLRAVVMRNSDEAKKALLRAGVSAAYANWEGFVSFAAKSYLKFVHEQALPLRQLRYNFVSIVHRDKLIACQHGSPPHLNLAVKSITDDVNDRKAIPSDIVDTKSNLRFNVLNDLFERLGVTMPSSIESRRKWIDGTLCDKRNEVAHGLHIEITSETYADIHEVVIQLMSDVESTIMNAAATSQYRAP